MIGVSVGPYQIVGKLGAGGMGEVFLGHDPRLQRRVALKCLTQSGHQPSDVHAGIMREARAAARLAHPNIAAVYDVLEHDGRTFIVMEYVEGENLAALLARERPPIDRVRSIGCQLASALASAHAHGVVHRDLKPANIQVTSDGSIKVLDFGVARLAPSLASSTGAPTDGLIAEATLGGNPGTLLYMSPEQLLSKEIDARSDIYSAGVILFEMATRRRPYLERGSIALALAMADAPAPPASSINPDVPPDLNEIIAHALERDPANRIQSARDLERALSGVSGLASTASVAVARTRRVRAPVVAAAALVVAVAALIAGSSASPAHPVALAILPVDNPTGDRPAGYMASAMATVVATNVRSLGSFKVLPRGSATRFASRRDDGAGMRRDFGSSYVLDLAVKRGGAQPEVVARLSTTDASTPVWQATLAGSPVIIEERLLDGVARALVGRVWWRLPLFNRDARARLRKMPTRSDAALTAYADAQALLERADLPGSSQRAIDRLQQAVAADAGFAAGYATLCAALLGLYEKTKDAALIGRATDAAAAAMRIDANLSAAQYASGYLQYVTGQRQDAILSLQRAIQLDPDDDAAHRLLGWRLFASQGRMDDAVDQLREAVAIRPDSFENHYRRGTVLYLAGRFQEAIESYRRATDLQPNRAEAYTNLGAAFYMMGDAKQAVGNFEHAIGLGAGDAAAYSNLALSYYFSGRHDEAVAASVEAVRRNPNRASLQRDLGDFLGTVGRKDEAQAAYTRAIGLAKKSLEVNSRDAEATVLIALCEAHLGMRAQAERHAAEAFALAGDDRDLLIRGAKTYVVLGDRREALDRLRQAVARGYSVQFARDDPEFLPLKSDRGFEEAIAAGLQARSPRGDRQQ